MHGDKLLTSSSSGLINLNIMREAATKIFTPASRTGPRLDLAIYHELI